MTVVAAIRAPDAEAEECNAERAKASNRERKPEARKKLPNNRRKLTRDERQQMKMINGNRAQANLAVESRRDREKLFNTLKAKVARIRSPSPEPSKTSPPTTRPTTPKTPTSSLSEDEVYSYPIS